MDAPSPVKLHMGYTATQQCELAGLVSTRYS